MKDYILNYPENEFPEYNIHDIIKILNRHKNKKITNKLIEQIEWEIKS